MEYSDNENGSDGDLVDDILGPEDLFNDEADEGNDIHSDSDHNEAVEDKKSDAVKDTEKKVKPKRVVRNPRVTLNFDTLKGPNGLGALKKLFQSFKFKGNGHEKEDLTKIMETLQQWMCYRLCPSYDFESCMLQLEALGKKKVVQTHMKKLRMGIDDWGENKTDDNDGDNGLVDNMEIIEQSTVHDNFDALLNEDITNVISGDEFEQNEIIPSQNEVNMSQPSQTEVTLTAEQLEKIARNRKLAEERRMKRMCSQRESMKINENQSVIREPEIPLESMHLDEHS